MQPAEACSRASRVPPSSASRPVRCTSRWTVASACPAFTLVGLPDAACGRAAIGCMRRSATPASSFPQHRIVDQPRAGGRPEGWRVLRPADRAGRARRQRRGHHPRHPRHRHRRRARARRHDSPGPRRAADRGLGPPGAGDRHAAPAGNSAEAAVVEGLRLLPVATLAEAVAVLNLRARAVAVLASGAVATARGRPHARPGRPPRPGLRPACARSGGGRRPQPADDRSARCGQDDAGATDARHPAAAALRRSAGGHGHPLGRRPDSGRRGAPGRAAVSARRITRFPTPRSSAAARSRVRARSASPITACSSSTRCPSSSGACSTRMRQPLEEGRDHRVARRAHGGVPGAVHAGRGDEPLPVRVSRQRHAACRCTPVQVAKYRSRISGPLRDRIDLIVEVDAVPIAALSAQQPTGEATARFGRGSPPRAHRQNGARRARSTPACQPDRWQRGCALESGRAGLTRGASRERLLLSARAYHRVLRVARTIADLAGTSQVARRSSRRGPSVSIRRVQGRSNDAKTSAGVQFVVSGV